MAEYKLSYTGAEVNEKLGMVDTLSSQVSSLNIPTKVSQLINDKEYLTAVPSEYVTESELDAKGYALQSAVDSINEEIVNQQAEIKNIKQQISGVTYTNVLTTAIGTNGKIYGDGKGYKTGYRANTTNTESVHELSCVTGYIPVKAGDVIRIKNTETKSGNGNHLFLNSNFEIAAMFLYENYEDTNRGYNTKPDSNGIITVTIPNEPTVAYYRYSTGVIDETSIFTINEEITESNGTGGSTNTGGEEVTSSEVEILLPTEAVAVVGVEFNIYHKSIVRTNRHIDNYDIKVYLNDYNVGFRQYDECFRLTAEADEVGDYTLTVEIRNNKDYAVIASKTMTLHIIENRTITNKNVLFIGDSLTFSRAGLYASEIQYNLSKGGIVSMGSQTGSVDINQIGTVKHEGYNGATVGGFLKANVKSGVVNPFYNPTSGSFDLAYFMSNQGYSKIDAVCLNLGHNNLGNEVAGVNDLKTLIGKIHSYKADLPIIISLITPLGGQDSHSHLGFTTGQMRFHWRQLIKAYIEAFDNGKISNVYLSTPYFNVDQDNDLPTETVARCSRDTTQIVRQNDSMHPTRIGTLKMADSYYADLLYRIPDTGVATYTITNNLTNVTNSNSATTIEEGSSYSATLTPASGCVLKTVNVTMGGTAVTVSNGVINIASVTGDIVITANAEGVVANLVDSSTAKSSPDTTTQFKDEWLNGYYLSANSISAKAGCIVTDVFPITLGQKIKVEGILLNTTEHQNRFRWWLFNADGTKPFGGLYNFVLDENTNNKGLAVVDATNNTATIDIYAAMGNSVNGVAYARFSCYPAGANEDVIVSVVE